MRRPPPAARLRAPRRSAPARRILAASAAALAAAGGLAACSSSPRPPGDTGVCYHVVQGKDGKLKYNVVARGVPNMETCGARLEAVREEFLRMGGSHENLTGAFQATYLFLDRVGVSASKTLDGIRYIALVRTGDGRLAVPGAIPDGAAPPPSR